MSQKKISVQKENNNPKVNDVAVVKSKSLNYWKKTNQETAEYEQIIALGAWKAADFSR